ncbi:MAG: tripartite tricarboxylate transporter substrate binding protein [Betaproteobacteria bacterium]|nr:tripartite tricarboxylate transporter substrate binding protein [Betaproteobacteria bacterium]
MKSFAALVLALLAPVLAHAQAWPARPVTIYLSNSAGSSPDIVLRQLTERLGRGLRQQIIIINQPGASGIPPIQSLLRAKPDGYTLLFAGNSQLTANSFLVKDLPYDPEKDLAPLAMVVDSTPFIVAANPDLKANSIPELIALARAQPGKLSYAVSGTLAPILGRLFNLRAGIDMVQVPYKDTMQGTQETVTGLTQINYQALTTLEPFHRAGKLKLLGVTSIKRFPVIPDVPAVSETIAGFSLDGWFVILGPNGIPPDARDRINREVDMALREPELQKRLAGFGFGSSGAGTPESIRAFMRGERENWQRIVRELNLQAQ